MSMDIDLFLDMRSHLLAWFSPEYEPTDELAAFVAVQAVAAPKLARGIFWYEEQKNDFEIAVQEFMARGWSVDEKLGPFAAFSEDEGVARDFAEQAVYGVVLVVEGLRGVSVEGLLQEDRVSGVDVRCEQEWLVPAGQKVVFDRIDKTGDVRTLYGRVSE